MRGPVARADITSATSATSGTVTRLTAALLRAGVIREVPSDGASTSTGRPRVPLDLDTNNRAVLSAHVGLNMSTVAAVDLRAGVVIERIVKHRSNAAENVLKGVAAELRTIRGELGGRHIIGAGVTSGGVIDPNSGVLVTHPRPDWSGVPVRQIMADGLGLEVVYDSEVNAEAIAELIYGRPADTLVTLFVGSVVEAALVVRQRIVRGAHGRAGSLAHLPVAGASGPVCTCGRRSCFGVVAANPALLAAGREQGIVAERETYHDIVARAADGDPQVRGLLRRRAQWVGEAVSVIVDFIDPDAVVLFGNATAYDDYVDDVRSGMRKVNGNHSSATVRPATFGTHAGAVSGAALLLDRYFADPVAYEPALHHAG